MKPQKVRVTIALATRQIESIEKFMDEHPWWRKFWEDAQQQPDLEVGLLACVGGEIARQRNELKARWLEIGSDWLLEADDDLPFTLDDLLSMMARALPVCGALYVKRGANSVYVLNPAMGCIVQEGGAWQVAEIGTGFKLSNRGAYLEILRQFRNDIECPVDGRTIWAFHQNRLVFDERVGRNRWLSEDYFADWLCWRAGIPVFADTLVRLNHLGADGTSYPLDGKWPVLPVVVQCEPPRVAEEQPAVVGVSGSLVIVLMESTKDTAQARRLTKWLVELGLDGASLTCHVGQIEGYPVGPNAMAMEIIRAAPKSWPHASAVLLMEPDCVPVSRDWIAQLMADWHRAHASGALILGSWLPLCTPVGHINGNLMFDPHLADLIDLHECPPSIAWDIHYAAAFSKVWMRTGLIRNLWRQSLVPEERFVQPECGTNPPVLIHGVKDESVWDYAKKMCQ